VVISKDIKDRGWRRIEFFVLTRNGSDGDQSEYTVSGRYRERFLEIEGKEVRIA
jgi:hypothetical protein